jgi:leader peptidase (prepilin peptidase)/N-methyltransferase
MMLVIFAGCLGAIIGSFANVIIHRLPRMLEHSWMREASAATETSFSVPAPPNLFTPRSHCPDCERTLRWWQTIPMLSYLILRGRCKWCNSPIPLRYLVVEFTMASWFAGYVATHEASQLSTWFWPFWGAVLLTLAIIDWRTFLLPDSLTLGLLWTTLIATALGVLPISSSDAILGAGLGYLVLFLPAWLFQQVTGRTGMAHGDFKLMAAVGAASGPIPVFFILLLASLLGIALAWFGRQWLPAPSEVGASGMESRAIPFGPMIVFAALVNLVWPIERLALQ